MEIPFEAIASEVKAIHKTEFLPTLEVVAITEKIM